MRRALVTLAKATISILLLYFSLHSVDVGALGARLSRLESGWIVLALFLLAFQVVLLAVRWRNISAACSANLPFILLHSGSGDRARSWADWPDAKSNGRAQR
jgi:uncharacterized membrane protein YbhN (UPF0104 family)